MKKALNFNGFKAVLVGAGSLAMVMSLSACGPVDAVRSTLQEDAVPAMPAPEVATYVVDLSGSTFPAAQLEALGSGINDFIAGESLGNPFADEPVGPRSLSLQFVTMNSAQAPRILLVPTRTSQELYTFTVDNSPNAEVRKRLWNGFVQARTEIWQSRAFEGDIASCVTKVIDSLGSQQLLPEALRSPANLICQDARQTDLAKIRLDDFVKNPNVVMGSDVEGAIRTALKNIEAAKREFPTARFSLVIASDLVDEVSLKLPQRLNKANASDACSLATTDAGNVASDLSAVKIVFVGSRNSKLNPDLLSRVQAYWTCYFNQLGITDVNEQSDLSGF
jgi:hypothetical protein